MPQVEDAPLDLPRIGFALPLGSEERWSDLLAVLVSTDPAVTCGLLGIDVDPTTVTVKREVVLDKKNRLDLLLSEGVRDLAAVEIKVMSGLGPDQLIRYQEALPQVETFTVVYPERLVVHTEGAPGWKPLTWERLLQAHANSGHAWVRTTARAWLDHLGTSLPRISSETVWNDIAPDTDFVVALRARMSWVYSQLAPPAELEHDIICSTAGPSWVVRMHTRAVVQGYRVMVEIEERLPVRDFPTPKKPGHPELTGPSAWIGLQQVGVTTSAAFDWHYLGAIWPVLASRDDWVQNRPNKRVAHEKEGHAAMVASGAPAYLGVGFGERQTAQSGICMFGARIQFSPTITLGKLLEEFRALGAFVIAAADVEPPS